MTKKATIGKMSIVIMLYVCAYTTNRIQNLVEREFIMKQFHVVLLLALLGTHATTSPARLAVAVAQAAQARVASMSQLEKDLHTCVEAFAPQFAGLTILNITTKKHIIEAGRVALLEVFEAADPNDMTKEYKEAKNMLEKLDVSKVMAAVQDFKKVLAIIPKTTRKVIDDTLTDTVIRKALGF